MIAVVQEEIHSIPSLVVVKANQIKKPLPLLLYIHGFTSAKEHNLTIAYLLATEGFRVVLPDCQYHGDRENEISTTERQISFWDIVMQNVGELSIIKGYFEQQGLILNNRIGVAGTSMGGITTAAALTQFPWIKVAAVLMGSPKITTYAKTLVNSFKKMGDLPISEEMVEQLYEQLKKYDLSKQIDTLANRPLLFWHGEHDTVVPFDHSYTFYDEIKNQYENLDHIRFIREENRGHKVSRNAILETVKWFIKFL